MKAVTAKAAALILASSYDTGTFYTHEWARALHANLVTQGHTALFLETEAVCRASTALTDAIAAVQYIVFYGNGTKDAWTAVPGAPGTPGVPLIDVNTVDRLADCGVYAGCSFSLVDLGSAYAREYPQGEFVGYGDEFSFEVTNRNLFGTS